MQAAKLVIAVDIKTKIFPFQKGHGNVQFAEVILIGITMPH